MSFSISMVEFYGAPGRPEADRRPAVVDGDVKPQPPPPPGGLVLTIYDRPLGRADASRYRHPEGDDCGGFRTHAPHGQRSSLWLTADDSRMVSAQTFIVDGGRI